MADKTRADIQAAIEQLGDSIPKEMKKPVEEALRKMYEQKFSVQQALNINPEMMEAIYTEGYRLFKAGKYQDAISVFSFLRNFEPDSYRYSFAIGACYQYLKDYTNAIQNYLLCSQFDLRNPIPHFHIYDCFMKLNQTFSALRELVATILLADENPEQYSVLKEKATLEFKKLKQDLKNHPLNQLEE